MNGGDFLTQYLAELLVVCTLFGGWFLSTFFDIKSFLQDDEREIRHYIEEYKLCGIKRMCANWIDKRLNSSKPQVSDRQQDIKKYLIEQVAEKSRVTCFSETAEKGLKVKWSRGYLRYIGGVLDKINKECAENGLPCLGCLVCKKWLLPDKQIPNSGFYGSAKEWEEKYKKKYKKKYKFCDFDDNSDYDGKILPYIKQCWKRAGKGEYNVLLKSDSNGENKTKK